MIRLRCAKKARLVELADKILLSWRGYTDEDAFIFAETEGTRHSTVTPIARKNGNEYECDIVLRNNITTAERPLGLYHPNPELHNIKKENIGLIEVMGLAVLPARLAKELVLIKDAILNKEDLNDIPELAIHVSWAEKVKNAHPEMCEENAMAILKQEVGKVFLNVLEDAGVFKRTLEGQNAFMKFIDCINL